MAEVPTDEIALVPTTTSSDTTRGSVQVVVRQNDYSTRKRRVCAKMRRIPYCYITVLSLGVLLLLSICSCIILEIYRNGALNIEGELVAHSDDDRKHHMAMVNEINRLNASWTARYNRFASRPQANLADLGQIAKEFSRKQNLSDGQILHDTNEHLKELIKVDAKIPESYDIRFAYPQCASVHLAPNQGGCGSCWSVSAASTMSDRVCIASNGSSQLQISAQDLTSCCTNCGGCQGTHWAHSSFVYWKENGLVTGGPFGSSEGCRPYEAAPTCGSPCSSKTYTKRRTPSCSSTCQPLYGKTYKEDLQKSRKAYWIWAALDGSEATPIVSQTIEKISKLPPADLIKKEIYLHGPILACFTLREDFQHYSKGIYEPNLLEEEVSKELYGHCAKLIGWGSDRGIKYWTYMNTWGRDWGENGFFRIVQSEIPEEAVGGLP